VGVQTSFGERPGRDALCRSARDYEARTARQIRAVEEENQRQGILMDEAGAMPVAAVHEFLQSVAGDSERLGAIRLDLAGYS
jgi:hypothetical protein